jgi:uncharacterized PurR-regulated membrane protein YhhQ (DUF165 family)
MSVEIRRIGVISVVVLLAQFLLGIAVNLWVTIGSDEPWSHIGNVALFGAHALFGVVIVPLTFVVLTKAFQGTSVAQKVVAMMSFFGVVGAAACGVAFVSSAGDGAYSFGMSIGWTLAVLCNLYLGVAGR